MKKIILLLIIISLTAWGILKNDSWNFETLAQDDPYASVKSAVASLPANSGVLILLPNGETISQNAGEQLPSFSVIKLWIAAAFLDAYAVGEVPLDETTTPLLENMIKNSDNQATNQIIDMLGGCSNTRCDQINEFISTSGFQRTLLRRKMLETPTPQNDNVTSPEEAVTFMQKLVNDEFLSIGTRQRLIDLLRARTATGNDPFKPNAPLPASADFIGKSGILGQGRNDVGTFLDASGNRVFFAVFVPNGGTGTDQVISNIEQLIYNPAAQPNTIPPTGTSTTFPTGQTSITARACVKVGEPTEPKPAICSQLTSGPTSGAGTGPGAPVSGGPQGINITCPVDQGQGFRYICGTSANIRNNCGHGNPSYYTACIPGVYVCPFGNQLKSAVDVRPPSGDGNGASVTLPYINGNQTVVWEHVNGPIAISGGSWGYRHEFETTFNGKRIRLDMTHISREITSSRNSGEQIATVYSGFDTDGGGHLHTSAAIDGQWIDAINESFYCSK